MEKQRIFIDDILSNENMNRAYKQVIKNKGAAGIDGMECNDLFSHLKVNGHQLRESIRNQSYKPMPVKRVEIPKDNGSKRKLGIPTVTDRMIQQAAAQVLTPIYERKFHTNSYGFRPGKSAQQAVLKAAEYMNEGYNWVVDIDLEKFFDTVEHDIYSEQRNQGWENTFTNPKISGKWSHGRRTNGRNRDWNPTRRKYLAASCKYTVK